MKPLNFSTNPAPSPATASENRANQWALRLMITATAAVFLSEFFIMLFLHRFLSLSETAMAALDSVFLVTIITPLLYFSFLRPMLWEMEKREKAEVELRGQHAFLGKVMESIGDPFYVVDADDYSVLLANPACGAGNFSAKPKCYELLHHSAEPCRAPGHACPIEILRESKKPATVVHAHPTADGDVKYVEVRAHPVFNEKGDFVQILEHTVDVTALKRAELALRESEKKYRDLVDSAIAGVVQSTVGGDILYANRALARMHGFDSPEELIRGSVFSRWKNPADRDAFIARLRKKGRVEDYEAEMQSATGEARIVVFSATLEGGIITAIVQDVTERKQAERSLQKKNAELEAALDKLEKTKEILIRSEKLSSIGTLSAGVAHEILNPLNIISTIVQVMKMETFPEDVVENLDEIMNQVNRAAKITNNLRMFAHQKKAEVAPVDVHALFDKTASLIERDLNLDNIAIERGYDENLPAIQADEDQLAQVFLNLLNNAKDAMKGRRDNIIRIQTKSLGDGIEIRFSDNGPGIPKAIIRKIFDPFFTTKDPRRGTGLGLSVLYSIIEKHGGAITVESEEGQGAAFIITLPLSPPPPPNKPEKPE